MDPTLWPIAFALWITAPLWVMIGAIHATEMIRLALVQVCWNIKTITGILILIKCANQEAYLPLQIIQIFWIQDLWIKQIASLESVLVIRAKVRTLAIFHSSNRKIPKNDCNKILPRRFHSLIFWAHSRLICATDFGDRKLHDRLWCQQNCKIE